jgi:hypothetical protein
MSKEIDEAFDILSKSESESEVISHLREIVKKFSLSLYKDRVLNNPYFKSLLVDIGAEALEDIENIRIEINNEISNIEKILSSNNNDDEDLEQLFKLKSECLIMIDKVDQRVKDLLELTKIDL